MLHECDSFTEKPLNLADSPKLFVLLFIPIFEPFEKVKEINSSLLIAQVLALLIFRLANEGSSLLDFAHIALDSLLLLTLYAGANHQV